MITGITHAVVYVLDHDEAKDFYVNRLGFSLGMDQTTAEGFRWLTVHPKMQPQVAFTLFLPKPPLVDEETAAMMETLIRKGAFGSGVLRTGDITATYHQLRANGVEFLTEPAQRPYGMEATFKDCFGNWFALVQT